MTGKTYVQFSKRMATGIMIFWALYRILLLILAYFRPELADVLKALLSGVDDVMIVSIGFYTGNSVIEKGIVGYFGAKGAPDTDDEPGQNG